MNWKIVFFWNSYGLQDAMSPVMEELIFFHDYIMSVLVFVTFFVLGILMSVMSFSWVNKSLVHGQVIESIWTAAPAVFLILIAIPSLLLLYSLDEMSSSVMTMKVIGNQWYWTYEYSDFRMKSGQGVMFNSYMLPSDELSASDPRLIETDNRPCLPYLTQIRILVSSADVLHSWAVPSLGVKMDAVPGRLNQTKLMSFRPGLAYGQCSEICGANHSFMPIVLEFVGVEDFLTTLSAAVEE